MSIKLQEEHIAYVVNKYEATQGNNTNLCFYLWKEVCKARNIPFDDRLLEVLTDYKPESIIRKRREMYPPSEEQAYKEEEYLNKYSK